MGGQTFKAVYFPDYKTGSQSSKAKSFSLAFGRKHDDLYDVINQLNSDQIRQALRAKSYAELEARARKERLLVNTYCLRYLQKLFVKQIKPLSGRANKTLINKVIEGDCLDVMRKIPDGSVNMILCDLPYGTTQNKWDSLIPLERLWSQYQRIIKLNGAIVLTAQGLFTAQLLLSNQKLFKYKIVWTKSKPTNFLNAKKQPLRKHEDICIFYKNQPVYNPQMTYGEPYNKGFRKNQLTGSYGDFGTVEVKSEGQRYPTDVIYFKTAESEGQVYHPTQKPVELGRYLIRTFTNSGDVVMDNACGSGSFLVAAALEGRQYIGIEKNQEVYLHKKHRVNYIEICNNRLEQARARYSSANNQLF